MAKRYIICYCYRYFLTYGGHIEKNELGQILINCKDQKKGDFKAYFIYNYPLDYFLQKYYNQKHYNEQ